MMVQFHRKFDKAIKKQPKKVQIKFKDALRTFKLDQFHPSLNNHALQGKFLGTRSFDVTGDVRVHFEELEYGVILTDIGTHSQLYR